MRFEELMLVRVFLDGKELNEVGTQVRVERDHLGQQLLVHVSRLAGPKELERVWYGRA